MTLFIHTYLSSKRLSPITTSLVLLNLLFVFPLQAEESSRNENAQQQSREKLTDIQKAIAKQQSNIFDANKQRSSLEQQLKTDDLAISKVAKAINKIEVELSTTQDKISVLAIEKKQLT
ncbi:MAG: septal ring factor EnvC (AmiA/AmiB activator), partial [Colwellia sp.]